MSASSGSVSTVGLLGVVFVVLKLVHTIDWSWWWVTAPFWMPVTLVVAFTIVSVIFVLAASLLSMRSSR
jgi:hypothetical protein